MASAYMGSTKPTSAAGRRLASVALALGIRRLCHHSHGERCNAETYHAPSRLGLKKEIEHKLSIIFCV